MIKPETVLKWAHKLIKRFWTYPSKKRRGRPGTPFEIKQLVLEIKNKNIFWGNGRIQGELLKLGISLDKRTIAKIITDFRKKGKIKNGLTWKQFLKAHIRTLFAIDLFTVDTVLGKKYYVFFLIRHFNRKIIQYGITTNPLREFIRQQIIEFSDTFPEPVYVIHDRSPELYLNYKEYNIKELVNS